MLVPPGPDISTLKNSIKREDQVGVSLVIKSVKLRPIWSIFTDFSCKE